MATPSRGSIPANRHDDIEFIKLFLEVERLTAEMRYLSHLLYVPNGHETLLMRVETFHDQHEQRLDTLERELVQQDRRREQISQRLWTLGLSALTTVIAATLVLLWRLSFVTQAVQAIKPPS